MEKSSKLIIILLILLLITVLGLGGYLVYTLNNKIDAQGNELNNLKGISELNSTIENEVISNTAENNIEDKNNITTDTNTSEDLPSIKINEKQKLLNVMKNKSKFINEDNKKILLNDFKVEDGNKKAEVSRYTFVDFDQDDIQELVIETTSYFGEYIILHYEDGQVYGYLLDARAISPLKADGSFGGSSGADNSTYSRIKFNKNSIEYITEAIYNDLDKNYVINDKNVSKKEINNYIEKWNKKKDASWVEV